MYHQEIFEFPLCKDEMVCLRMGKYKDTPISHRFFLLMANFRHLMKNEGLQTVQRSFFEKKRKFTTFRRKKKVEPAITRALVLLCHKCIVELKKPYFCLGSLAEFGWSPCSATLAKLKKYPDFTMGKLE